MGKLVLLTGGTGYVGGRLLPLLSQAGHRVRCLARRPEALVGLVPEGVEVARGDVLDEASLEEAMRGVDAAYYLVHSMGSAGDFSETDRKGAANFAAAAKKGGVGRIVYLGALGGGEPGLSPHLKSRHEVGDLLRSSGVPVVEFQASVIIGSGSLSFELVRSLIERLPVLVMPKWVRVPAQPIFIRDVLKYLLAALDLPDGACRVFEIGGADVVSYQLLMREYARQRGLRRWMIPVPVLSPRLSSLWLGLVTPVFARVGRKLIDSIRHPTVVKDPAALAAFAVRPVGVQEAIAGALRREDARYAETRWSDALSASGEGRNWGGKRFGNRLVDSRTATVSAGQETAFAAIERIGGEKGWYYGQSLWRARGWVDLLMGGVGMRRGRRNPERLHAGEVVDCWRVEAIERGRSLKLAAEMKLPGRAWLEFEVGPGTDGGTAVIRQTAVFDPLGVAGLAYWYGIWPLHQVVFAGMLRSIRRAAEGKAG